MQKLTAAPLFGKLSPLWAHALHPSSGSLIIDWASPDERVMLKVLFSVTVQRDIGIFEIYGSRILLTAVRLNGIDARHLFLDGNRDALESSFVIDLISRLISVPAESILLSKSAERPTTQGENMAEISRNSAMLVRWSNDSRGLEFDFLMPLESDVGVNLLTNRRVRSQIPGYERNLIIPVQLGILDVQLTLPEINSLSAGDVILGLSPPNDCFACYVRSESFCGKRPALLTLGGTSMSLSPYEADAHNNDAITDEEYELESEISQSPSDHENENAVKLRGLATTFKIDCVLSGLTMTFKDLQKLENGHVLTLPVSPWHAQVNLRLGEQVIGRGRLTTVNDVLAVQIVETYLSQEDSQV